MLVDNCPHMWQTIKMQKNKRYSIRVADDIDDFISKKMKGNTSKAERISYLARTGIEFLDIMDELRKIIKERK